MIYYNKINSIYVCTCKMICIKENLKEQNKIYSKFTQYSYHFPRMLSWETTRALKLGTSNLDHFPYNNT